MCDQALHFVGHFETKDLDCNDFAGQQIWDSTTTLMCVDQMILIFLFYLLQIKKVTNTIHYFLTCQCCVKFTNLNEKVDPCLSASKFKKCMIVGENGGQKRKKWFGP